MIERSYGHHWDRLLFRDYLVAHSEMGRQYGNLKRRLADTHHGDRIAYHQAKSDFVTRATTLVKKQHHEAQDVPADADKPHR